MSLDEEKDPLIPAEEETSSVEKAPPAEEAPSATDAAEDRFSAFDRPVRPEEKQNAAKKRLNPRLRTLFIALGGVVLLTVILLLVLYLPRGEQPGSSSVSSAVEETTYPLIQKGTSTDTGLVTDLQVRNSKDHYTLKYDTGEQSYKLTGYEDLTLDSTTVKGLTEAMTALNASSKLETEGEAADYGLDQPVNITATYKDGTSHVLHIGNAVPSGSGYYVALDDDNTVYICNTSTMEPFLQPATSLVSTVLLSTPTVKSDDSSGKAILRELQISGSAHNPALSIRRAESDESTEVSYSSYVMTKPYYRGVSESVSNSLANLTALYASEAVALHPTAAQRESYGLNNPGTLVKLTLAVETTTTSSEDSGSSATVYYNSVTATLRIGKTDADGNYYCAVDGTDAVFLVPASSLQVLVERQYSNTVSDLLFIKDITTLGRVDITLDGSTHSFTLTHHADAEDNDQSMIVSEGDKTYSTPDFRTLYQRMMSFYRYTEKDTTPSGKANLAFSLYTTDGKQYMSVKFYPVSGSLYCVETSEGETFSTKASTVEDFITQYKNYLDGKPVLDM
mgnify:CR=1 FL=1